MPPPPLRHIRRAVRQAAVALCCAVASFPAWSFGLGNLEVHSFLGMPFSATIPVELQEGEQLSPECLAPDLSRRGEGGVPQLSGIRLALEKGGRKIRVTTSQAVNEPAVRFWVKAECAAIGRISREYVALLDPPTAPSPLPAVPAAAEKADSRPAKTPVAAPPQAVETWRVKPGDTLSGIAHDIHPWNTALQKKLAKAIIEANPEKFDPQQPNSLKAGTVLKIPQLAGSPAAVPAAPPAAPRKAKRDKPATAPTAQAAKPLAAPALGKPADDFRLKLASPEDKKPAPDSALATAPAAAVSDDQTARLLALTHQVGQLEAYLADTHKQLALMERELKQIRMQPPPPPPDNSGWIAAVIAALFGGALAAYLFLRHGQTLREGLSGRFGRKTPSAEASSGQTDEPGHPFQAQPRLLPRQEAEAAPDMDTGRNAISVSFSDSLPDDTSLYLSRDMSDQTLAAMEKHVTSDKSDAAPWLTLLGIYADRSMAGRFDALAAQFKQAFDAPDLGQKVRELAQRLETANPILADDLAAPAEDLDFDSLVAPHEAELATDDTAADTAAPADLDQTLILRAPLDLEVAQFSEDQSDSETEQHLDIELAESPAGGEEALPPLDLPLGEEPVADSAEEKAVATTEGDEEAINLLDIPLEFSLPVDDRSVEQSSMTPETGKGEPLEMIELPPLEMEPPSAGKPSADGK